MKTIKIKYHGLPHDVCGMPQIKKIKIGDWIDLFVSEDVVLKTGDYKLIDLGISMKLPKGYEAHVVPRSSTFQKYGVLQANSMGVIDNSYCGDNDILKFPAYATRDTSIKKGDRICQFRIIKKQPTIRFKKVMALREKDRGGFGSTGI